MCVKVVVEAGPPLCLHFWQLVYVEKSPLLEQIRDVGPQLLGHGVDNGKAGKAAGCVQKTHGNSELGKCVKAMFTLDGIVLASPDRQQTLQL